VPGSLKLSSFEPTGRAHVDNHVWGAMLEKYHKLQPKTKTTDELKAAYADHALGNSCHKNTLTRRSIFISLPTNRLFPELLTDYQ